MKKRRKLSIWTIVFTVIILIFFGWLVYQYFFAPSAGMSNVEFEKKLAQIQTLDQPKKKLSYIRVYRTNVSETGTVEVKLTDKDGKINIFASVYLNLGEIREKIRTWDFVRNERLPLDRIKNNALESKLEIRTTAPINVFGLLFSWLPTLLWLALIGFILLRTMSAGAGFTGKFKGSELTTSDVKFSDVAGIEEEKKELLEIVDFLRFPQKYVAMGARIPKGLLLFGPPGTGKTLLAKAVSGESKVPFFSVAGSEFEEVLVGMGAARIRQLFQKAKENSPCIIFIDEIDSLGSHRSQGVSGVKDQTLNQFLSELDGFESNLGVVVIAATNRADILDPALLRSGRFDRKIQITLPDVREREQILKIHSRNKRFDKKIDFAEVAARTPGFTGAQLENSLNEAALLAVRKNQTIIVSSDIDEGIDRVIGGPAKVTKVVNEKTRILVSIHEAGHALIGLLLSDAMKVQKVTIIPRGSAGGYTITTPKDESSLYSKETLEHQLIGLLAGRGAEEVIFGSERITTGGHDDFSKATAIAKQMVERFGMSDAGLRYHSDQEYNPMLSGMNLSEAKKKENDREIDRILADCADKAKMIIRKEKTLLFLLAEALLVLETITSEDIDYIFKERQLPERVLQIKAKNPDKIYLNLSLFNATTVSETDNKKPKT